MSCVRHMYWRDEPPKCLVLKTNIAYVQESHRAVGDGDSTLKVLMVETHLPRTQHRSSSLRSAKAISEGDSLVILKAFAKGRVLLGLSLGMETLVSTIFGIPLHPASTSAGGCHFYHSPSNLLVPVNMPFSSVLFQPAPKLAGAPQPT